MRHRKHTFKIGRTSEHRKALLSNMVSSLIRSGRISTTLAKAKEARRLADKVVTLAKRGTLHDRRRAISILGDREAVGILFNDLAARFISRNGGYTRIIKLGPRIGDAAEMCFLEYVEALVPAAESPVELVQVNATDVNNEDESANKSE